VANPKQLISHPEGQVTASGRLMRVGEGEGLAAPTLPQLPRVFTGALDQQEEGSTARRGRWKPCCVPGPPEAIRVLLRLGFVFSASRLRAAGRAVRLGSPF